MIEWIISSSVLIAVIVALRYIFKGKISLRLQYALWALMLLRLLVPVSLFSHSLSVISLIPAQTALQVERAADSTLGYVGYELPDLSVAEPDPNLSASEQEAQYNVNVDQYNNEIEAAKAETGVAITAGTVLYTIWLAGIIFVALCLLLSNLRFYTRLKKTRKETDNTDYPLKVYVSDVVDTPCLFGLFRPAIYATPEVVADETTLRHVIAHETTHYRHGDHIWSALRGVCLALHWFNPLVWLAASFSRRDAELACDESTIKRIGEDERNSYGRTLINLTCQKRGSLLVTATTMTGSRKSINERITLIAKKPKMAIYTLVAIVLIAAVAVGCTFTGAKTEKETVTDAYFNVSNSDPIETVRDFLKAEKAQDYTISLEIHEVALSESDTAKIIEDFVGREFAESKNWTDEYIENNVVGVAAYYSAQYDHEQIFYNDGDFVRIFYLEYDDETSLWTIWDNDGGIELDVFLNGSQEWPECLIEPESMGLVSNEDFSDIPDIVLTVAEAQAAEDLLMHSTDYPDYDYIDWRINNIKKVYTYDNFYGLTIDIYEMTDEFLSNAPEKVMLPGGMSTTDDGWVWHAYFNYLVFDADSNSFLLNLVENDCSPGTSAFDEDLAAKFEAVMFPYSDLGLTPAEGILEQAVKFPYEIDFRGYIADLSGISVFVDEIIWDTEGNYDNGYAIINDDESVTEYTLAEDCEFWILKNYWYPCQRLDYETFAGFLVTDKDFTEQYGAAILWVFTENEDGEVIMIGMQYQP